MRVQLIHPPAHVNLNALTCDQRRPSALPTSLRRCAKRGTTFGCSIA
jgi:hypothetical protein